MFETLDATTYHQPILFAEDFPVRMSAMPGAVLVWPESDPASGLSSYASFARLDHDGSWLKMYEDCFQVTADGTLEQFSEDWPSTGMMRSGQCYRLPSLGPHIFENGYSLWPTPVATDSRRLKFSKAQTFKALPKRRRKGGAVDIPTVMMEVYGAYPTLSFYEWMMGFPIRWIEDAIPMQAMPLSQRSPNGSGAAF